MIVPLTHERMTVQRLPWVTIAILGFNFIVFVFTWPLARRDYERVGQVFEELQEFAIAHPSALDENCGDCPGRERFADIQSRFEQARREHLFSKYGYVPARPSLLGLVGSLFLHAGWLHLLGNLYLLWLCGCSIEDLWGRPLYALVYLSGGAGAALVHGAFQPESTAHLVGASGSISALMGVFLVRCHDTRIRFFYWFFLTIFGTFYAPAWIMLLLWLMRELFYAFVYAGSSSVAFWAHIGGFGFGVAVASAVKLTGFEERFIAPSLERKTNLMARHPKLASALDNIERGNYQVAARELTIAAREDRDDPDLLRLLAQCYQALERPRDAERWLRAELALHARRRDPPLLVETYREILATAGEPSLTSRELLAVASALVATGDEDEAARFYERLSSAESEPPIRLRAAIALADIHHRNGRDRRALELMESIASLGEAHPEWRSLIDEKLATFKRSAPLPIRPSGKRE